MIATPGDYAPPLSPQPRMNVSGTTEVVPTTVSTAATVTKARRLGESAVDGRSGSMVASIVWIVSFRSIVTRSKLGFTIQHTTAVQVLTTSHLPTHAMNSINCVVFASVRDSSLNKRQARGQEGRPACGPERPSWTSSSTTASS